MGGRTIEAWLYNYFIIDLRGSIQSIPNTRDTHPDICILHVRGFARLWSGATMTYHESPRRKAQLFFSSHRDGFVHGTKDWKSWLSTSLHVSGVCGPQAAGCRYSMCAFTAAVVV